MNATCPNFDQFDGDFRFSYANFEFSIKLKTLHAQYTQASIWMWPHVELIKDQRTSKVKTGTFWRPLNIVLLSMQVLHTRMKPHVFQTYPDYIRNNRSSYFNDIIAVI